MDNTVLDGQQLPSPATLEKDQIAESSASEHSDTAEQAGAEEEEKDEAEQPQRIPNTDAKEKEDGESSLNSEEVVLDTDTHGQPESHSKAESASASASASESENGNGNGNENKPEPELELENEASRPISDSGACSPAELSAAKHAQPEPVEASAAVDELAEGPLQDESPPMPATGLPGLVFIVGAVDKLLATREGKKKDAKAALDKMQQVLAPKAQQHRWLTREEIDTILEAFGMLCVAQSTAATLVIALDCIEKLVSFHYFDNVTGLVTV
ncbi:hypothetical protein LPJ66_008864, partial [Kickxella alabastrina]